MNYITDKLEQAIFIRDNGCYNMNCNICSFMNGMCRIAKSMRETDDNTVNKVKKYIKKQKENEQKRKN